ncbi:2-amino-4-ketopentanoate thiolase [Ruminococcaceae bacterium OttesenSCG-928-A11]|nr:2-amino-4-ketopentanoate thiolase [Ruminococcaceae bacterium OttesenSCG-928-A11]
MVKKGTWVSIRKTLLEAAERTGRLPEETKKVPLVMWNKGYLAADAEIGDKVTVTTRTGRTQEGILEEAEPHWELGYGNFVPELLRIGDDARKMLFGGDDK